MRAFRAHIQRALYKRDDETLATWVRQTWIGLGGPECLVRGEQIHWAEAFFQRLGAVAEGEDLDDPARLGQVVAQAQFADDAATPRGVQIMTIHRAKGLEFDTVVMLGLGREPRREPARALYWQETVDSDGRRDLLLGAPVPLGQSASTVTAYLRTLEQENDKAERTRLLYVGATRARERLHLIARIDAAATRPAPRSLLGQIWSEFEPLLGPPSASGPGAWEARSFSVPLRRLREVRVVSVPGPVSSGDDVRPEFIWAGSVAAHVGTVVHRELRLLADRAEPGIGCREVRDCSRFRRQLALLGVEEFRLDEAAQRVADALLAVLEDPCGRWILAPHEDAGSEIVLNVMGPGGPEQMRLDRTFLDNGRRWIIDYKVGVHEGGDLAAYLDREVERYSPQLERYAAAMRRIETESIETGPIELGLYFPLIRQFRSWTAQS